MSQVSTDIQNFLGEFEAMGKPLKLDPSKDTQQQIADHIQKILNEGDQLEQGIELMLDKTEIPKSLQFKKTTPRVQSVWSRCIICTII